MTGSARGPRHIGRYEVLGKLADGGMAEILLGRLTGPRGFEHAVVLKRMLPGLARSREFVDMFVDEAGIAAAVKHPNVVGVHELGRDGDELFLVLEYLEGESAGGLARRLWTRGAALDRRLAAHVIAEACSGLHAAHELTDETGKLRDVVHRDVSPQNVFITYRGEVTPGTALLPRMRRSDVPVLSAREQQVLARLPEGETLESIADALEVSRRTVKTYVSRIYTKLRVQNRAQAVVVAARHGLLPSGTGQGGSPAA